MAMHVSTYSLSTLGRGFIMKAEIVVNSQYVLRGNKASMVNKEKRN
jgi:hypothetical protein